MLLLAILLPSAMSAQRKQVSEARALIRGKSGLDKAEGMMRELLKDPAGASCLRVRETLAAAVRAQYGQANERLYLGQAQDTAEFFLMARRMFLAYEGLDSAAAMGTAPGRRVRHRKGNARMLDRVRANLYNGGVYFLRKGDMESAYSMMDAYLDCARQPLFSGQGYGYATDESATAMFSTLYSGYRLGRADSALKYKDRVLDGERHRRRALRYLVRCHQMRGDTASYVSTLLQGFRLYPGSQFFVTRIVDHYVARGRLDSALAVIDTALGGDPGNASFLLARGNVLLNMGRYAECVEACDSALAIDPALGEAYLNAGTAWFDQAVTLSGNQAPGEADAQRECYMKAMSYLERYREVAPGEKGKWAHMLYNVYLNLNMGDEFERMSDVIRGLGN